MIPALEALHKAWSSRAGRDKYAEFADALAAGINKIVEYYNKTAESDVHVFAMCMSPHCVRAHTCANTMLLVLDPSMKAEHLKKFWTASLQKEALEHAEMIVCVVCCSQLYFPHQSITAV